jgi:alpha-1,6-mannosyltransferase
MAALSAVRLTPERVSSPLRALALGGLVVSGLLLCMHAASGATGLIPASWHGMPEWLEGPLPEVGPPLGDSLFTLLFAVMCGCYLAVLALPGGRDGRLVAGTIVVLQVGFMLAPPLLSSDIFGYIAWARMGLLHGLDPYAHGSLVAPHDPSFAFWRWGLGAGSPYGPAFTVGSYLTAPLGVAGALWAFKAAAGAAALACVWLVAACARRLGSDPVRAAAFVGLNPLLLVWAVGGGHNDLILVAVTLAGVWLALAARERSLSPRR